MWSPSQLSRSQSTHSVALSIGSSTSSHNSLYSHHATSSQDTNHGEHENQHESILSAYQDEKQQVQSPQQLRSGAFGLDEVPLWNHKKRTLTLNSREHFMVAAKQHHELHQTLELERTRSGSVASDDTHATLAEEEEHQDNEGPEMDLKTPTVTRHKVSHATELGLEAAGPMSQLLHSLLLRVADVERAQPTVMADDYAKMQTRLADLERENQAILKSHNDLLAIRNEDLMNLIKVRDLLAKERREHAAIRKLRDEDLENVLILRGKLAKATWSGKLQISTSPALERRSYLSGGAMTPTLPQRMSRSSSDDLWQQAKKAAMEQRVLELEKANAELKAAQTATSTAAPAGDLPMSRVEDMFEDSLRQRERMATKVQQLRSEKEGLQKEVASLEDRNSELEAVVERLKRGASIGH